MFPRSALSLAPAMLAFTGFAVASSRADEAVVSQGGMVVSVSNEASEAGLRMLRAGGSAVDAAVATAAALAVTFPEAGNLGGGGFMLVLFDTAKPPLCVDYRETAPAAATTDMFAADTRQHGHRVVGTPGTVAGLALAHERFGRLPWRDLLQPAIRLADEGFTLNAYLAESLNRLVGSSQEYEELKRVYGRADGRAWREGDLLVQADLARTLRTIAETGPRDFYEGAIARQIVAEMEAGGGLVTAGDLAVYRPKTRPALHGRFRGYDVYGPPPVSSGGTVLIEMLNVLENFDLSADERWSPVTAHLLAETMKRVYRDRAMHLGDPDFVEIPSHLTTKEHARELAASIDREHATPSETLAPHIELADEGASTTHFSVVDADGMAVANTYTLQDSYGSRVVVRGAGFLLNNEMTDFNWRPGHTDRSGVIGTPANTIAPKKRMLSSQSPTIVTRDGRLVLVTGSPGGRTIPNTVLNVVLNVLVFDMDIRQAVDAPRMHHQWLPDRIQLERAAAEENPGLVEALEGMGHIVSLVEHQGDAHSIQVIDGARHGAADHRRMRGKAAAE